MGIALLAFSGFFQGLSRLHRHSAVVHKPQRSLADLPPVWATRQPVCRPQASRTAAQPPHGPSMNIPTLRILRVIESDQRVKGAGRMLISGRMADVCAELDRLAAIEATQIRN